MQLLQLALRSALNRKISLLLSILSIAISIFLLLSVDTIRKQSKATFLSTISQTDLIVGARSGPENLLLYSVFHIGNATNNIPYTVYEHWASHPKVKWAVPISLGDSHKGFRVTGTTTDYFSHYQFKNKQRLSFIEGQPFSNVYDAVLGHDVAQQLGYAVGQKITLTHGLVTTGLAEHDDKPFTITGVLNKTGTPVDKSIFVPLLGLKAIHIDWQGGMQSPIPLTAKQAQNMALEPESVTAFMLGLKSKVTTFRLQREINEYREEPLLAILPGVTLASLWRTLGQFEKVLLAVSALVLLTGLVGLLTTLLTSLNERRREIAVLRAIGMRSRQVFFLFALESVLIVTAGCVLGMVMMYGAQLLFGPLLEQQYGVYLEMRALDMQQWGIVLAAIVLGAAMSALPAFIAYKRSLEDGLSVQL